MNELRSRLRDLLERHDTMTLATNGPSGEPHAAALFYAVGEELELYFLSSPGSRHSENLTRDPRVAATIQADGQPWREIRGLQLEGSAHVATDKQEVARAAQVFASRFAFLQGSLADSHPKGPLELQGPLAGARFFVLRPTWIRWIDNTKGFGHKEELTLPGAHGG
jgi:uncharacterized protein YhbP (UPF0306 family)